MMAARLVGATVQGLQDGLWRAAISAGQLDTRAYELSDREELTGELLPRVREVIRQAAAAFEQVFEQYERGAAEPGVPSALDSDDSSIFGVAFDQLVEEAAPPDPARQLADMCFMARWELNRKRDAVEGAASLPDTWGLLSECCSTRRRIVKASTGIERVLSEHEQVPSAFDGIYRTERERAVQTRTLYFKFVRGLQLAEIAHANGNIARCLRLAGTGIARIIGADIYQDLRVKDRREMRALQARIFDWLRSGGDERSGTRLMSDVTSFAGLLMEVNHRSVLMEHDLSVLLQLREALAVPSCDKAKVFQSVRGLIGRDEELDRLIGEYVDLKPSEWQPAVDRVLKQLSAGGS